MQGGYSGTGVLDADPGFANGPAGDFHLLASSPCIDSGYGDSAPTVDLEGNPRVDDPGTPNGDYGTPGYVDRGAFEYQP